MQSGRSAEFPGQDVPFAGYVARVSSVDAALTSYRRRRHGPL